MLEPLDWIGEPSRTELSRVAQKTGSHTIFVPSRFFVFEPSHSSECEWTRFGRHLLVDAVLGRELRNMLPWNVRGHGSASVNTINLISSCTPACRCTNRRGS